MDKIKLLNEIIKDSNNIVFFGGAGVSTESGIPDFRSTDGLYNQHYDYPPEIILSHTFFMEHPDVFYKFYFDKLVNTDIKPNACHTTLKKLEDTGKLKGVITQNIDGLHEMADTKNVITLHGTIYKNHCVKCHKEYSLDDMIERKPIPMCECGDVIKPDVVLYEEPLNDNDMSKAIKLISECDTLIIGGTSLNVYPAAGLINYFNGKHLVIINRDNLNVHGVELEINDSIAKVFSEVNLNV